VTCLVKYSNSVVDVLSCFAKVCFTFMRCVVRLLPGLFLPRDAMQARP